MLHIFPHGVGGGVRIGADGDGDLQVQGGAEAVQPVEELAHLALVVAAGDLAQVVDEDVGNIVIAGVQAADKAPQGLKAVDRELGGVDHAGLVAQVEAHIAGGLDAHHAPDIVLRGVLHQLDELLCLALTRAAHDQSNHMKSLLYCIWWTHDGYRIAQAGEKHNGKNRVFIKNNPFYVSQRHQKVIFIHINCLIGFPHNF